MPLPSPTQVRQELQWRRWARDEVGFIQANVMIQHPMGRRLFVLRPPQLATLRALVKSRLVIILKARQIGYTTLMAAHVLWLAIFREDQNIILLSRTERDAQDFLRKVKYAYDHLPHWLKQRAPALRADTLQKLEFTNNSVIESLPSKDDPARGRTVTLVIVDEWASLENPEEAWGSILPITDIGGRFVGLSTAKGWGNFFHTMWMGARAKTNDLVPLFYNWRSVPERDSDWYATQCRNMPADLVKQEFPDTEDEAFLRSARTVFDLDVLLAQEVLPARVGSLWSGVGSREFRLNPTGELSVFQNPTSGGRYSIGADVAEGDGGDYSSAHVLDDVTGEEVANWHGWVDPDLFGDVLDDLGRWYHHAMLVVERNASGLSVCRRLQRLSYPRLYYQRTLDDRTKRVTSKVGWYSSRTSKPLMINDLAAALRDGALLVRSEETVTELKGFVRDENGKMGGSPHDDRVISLALAQQGRQHVYASYQDGEAKPQRGTVGWEINKLLNRAQPDEWVIGAHSSRRTTV